MQQPTKKITAGGPTTRTVELPSGERFRFTKEALAGMADQTREQFIPMNIEHLTLMPPIGRWYDAEVVDLDDGESQLVMHGAAITHFDATDDLPDPFAPPEHQGTGEGPPLIPVGVEAEARNYDSPAWNDIVSAAPVPVEAVHKWAALPPIEWILAIPVTWGMAKFAGSFLDRLGASAAEGLIGWVTRSSQRAKSPDRDRFVTLRFEIDDRCTVYGFVPFTADDGSEPLQRAIDAAGTLAEVAGAQRSGTGMAAHAIAYGFDGTRWRLAWFVTDRGAFRTRYYLMNMPQTDRFLESSTRETRSD